MATIPTTLGHGGAHLTPGGGNPDLLTILDDIADDLAALQPEAVVATVPSAVTATAINPIATADANDPATTMAMANEVKAKVNEVNTRLALVVTAVNSLRTLVSEMRTGQNTLAAVTLATVASDA